MQRKINGNVCLALCLRSQTLAELCRVPAAGPAEVPLIHGCTGTYTVTELFSCQMDRKKSTGHGPCPLDTQNLAGEGTVLDITHTDQSKTECPTSEKE